MTDESAVKPEGRVERQRKRLTSRWRGNLNQVETEDGTLHIATVSSQSIAEHIATLHNRTFGDGQDPDPRLGAFRHLIAGVQMADEAPLAWQHPPATAVGQYLRHVGAPAYVAEMADIVEQEVQRRVTEYAAREPARISIAESPDAMADMLRKLNYRVVEPAVGFYSCGLDGNEHEHASHLEAMGCMAVRGLSVTPKEEGG